jgi:hypothetical protein
MLIFVFTGVSCGRTRAILAEFLAVPNVQPENPAANTPVDVRAPAVVPTPVDPPVRSRVGGGETGGPKGPEPTRFGDWERNGRCIDF